MSELKEIQLNEPEFVVVAAQAAEQWKKQAAEAQDKLIRTMAEWDNARKRLSQEKQESVKYANEALLESLLPVVDNFDLGMQAASSAADAKSIAIGLQMVYTQLQNFLKESGLEPIEALGKNFDPHRHEALGHLESTDKPEGTVLSQTRRGYLYKGKLLRPAMVYVAKAPSSEPVAAQ
jgi:molecular chaperone GrpE